MANVVVSLILIALVGAAAAAIVRAKRKGQACIGCPDSASCPKACHCGKNKQDS